MTGHSHDVKGYSPTSAQTSLMRGEKTISQQPVQQNAYHHC
jgi:hypothetical protein